jgi:para-aminobenzoate synthetase component I
MAIGIWCVLVSQLKPMRKFSEEETILEMKKMGQSNRPFLFIISFDKSDNLICPLSEVDPAEIKYAFNDGFSSFQNFVEKPVQKDIGFRKTMVGFEKYLKSFDLVKRNLDLGNSFLTNLTVSNPIQIDIPFDDIVLHTNAKFKLWLKDEFVCFSPESFVSVNAEGKISSFPMKGTMDAAEVDAEFRLLEDLKEKYEHTTIVDLIRNDLSKVCDKVWVERFRYIDRIKRNDCGELLQVSSEVCGYLPTTWKDNIGDWFFELLPAGSISGAPKNKTIEIIKEAERELHFGGRRNYYTGVFGLFDGEVLTSTVMIRFIEKTSEGLVYKSGGGLTSRSNAKNEYEEINQKIYVPVF